MAKFEQSDIFINRENRTGVSVQSGEPVDDIRDLPPYQIEIWTFGNDHEASVFIAGLDAAGTGNSLIHDRNLGSTSTNKVVIVGRMDQEVSPDAPFSERVRTMEVPRINADSEAIRKHHERTSEANRLEAEKNRAEMQFVMDGIDGEVFGIGASGRGWARVGKRFDESFHIAWKDPNGPFVLTKSVDELRQGFLDVFPQMQAMADQYGCVLDEEWDIRFKEEIADFDAVRAAVAVLKGLVKDLQEERARIYRADFESKTKMTAKWARMILAGRDGGIWTTTVRRMERARIGGDDIGRSDIHTLLSMNWVERGGAGLMPTEAGLAAAALKLGKSTTPLNN
ncbi:hypothetical protein G6L37_04680 [Agrobacterium rubi]|nr:hypothetical protein [Agrobacterium rubi]NTF24649.1 hypothetical protein [Agrobacterium rubi]